MWWSLRFARDRKSIPVENVSPFYFVRRIVKKLSCMQQKLRNILLYLIINESIIFIFDLMIQLEDKCYYHQIYKNVSWMVNQMSLQFIEQCPKLLFIKQMGLMVAQQKKTISGSSKSSGVKSLEIMFVCNCLNKMSWQSIWMLRQFIWS